MSLGNKECSEKCTVLEEKIMITHIQDRKDAPLGKTK